MSGAEEKKIKALARQYRKRGFEVFANLAGFENPPRYGRHTPDFVAKKGNQVILVEVIHGSGDISRKETVAELARYAADRENVRFDLVVIRPESAKRVSSRHVLKRLRGNILRELELCSERLPHVFVVLYATAVEDLLVSAAAKKQIEIDHSENLPQLAEYLRGAGVITPVIVDFAKDAWDMRNRVVHDPGTVVSKQEMKQRLAKFKRLVTDYGWAYEEKDLRTSTDN